MGLSKNIHTYVDVHQILHSLIPHNGGTYRLNTPKEAYYWRMRANMYRTLARKEGIKQFDAWTFIIPKDDPCAVVITPPVPLGEITTPDGKKISPMNTLPEDLFPKPGVTTPEGKQTPALDGDQVAFDLAERIRQGKIFDE